MTADSALRGYHRTAHYLLYWKLTPEERLDLTQARPATYAAGAQLRRVKPGDVLWLVNVYRNNLFLVGRLQVDIVVNDSEIAQELVDPSRDEDFSADWDDAEWYAIANRYQVEPLREINITQLAEKLRFRGLVNALTLREGRIEINQLRMLRQLTPESADWLETLWYDEVTEPETAQDFLELTEDDRAYTEGRQVIRTVKQRQRSRQLIEEAKARFRARHGRLFCEVCGFDFERAYGVAYIEAHHIQAVSLMDETGAEASTPDDLVMLCANCHRVAHTRTPPYSLDELKAMRSAHHP